MLLKNVIILMWKFQKKMVDTGFCLVWNVIIYESVLSLGLESLK